MSTTESSSHYNDLEKMSTKDLLANMNREDQTVPLAIEKILLKIELLVEAVYSTLNNGGRLFYIGAGTSGRLGIVDASECPPTFGVPHGMVIGLIAGGDSAIRKAVEFAEDDEHQGWNDLQSHHLSDQDIVIGIAASGRTPYVWGALKKCQDAGITTGCVVCNENSLVAQYADHPVEIVVGPEFVTGSTRMKSGTAQKLVLNMITTAAMIRLGRVKGNKMVDMQLSNHKLVNRGKQMLVDELNITHNEAAELLEKHGNVRAAIKAKRDA